MTTKLVIYGKKTYYDIDRVEENLFLLHKRSIKVALMR